MYFGTPLTQIPIIFSAKSQNSSAYTKKPFSSQCLSMHLVQKRARLSMLCLSTGAHCLSTKQEQHGQWE